MTRDQWLISKESLLKDVLQDLKTSLQNGEAHSRGSHEMVREFIDAIENVVAGKAQRINTNLISSWAYEGVLSWEDPLYAKLIQYIRLEAEFSHPDWM